MNICRGRGTISTLGRSVLQTPTFSPRGELGHVLSNLLLSVGIWA